ncbi:Zinc finger protein [Nymphaea thermarum]|nr:Zinc finger protein [Nymphaea thermarum]
MNSASFQGQPGTEIVLHEPVDQHQQPNKKGRRKKRPKLPRPPTTQLSPWPGDVNAAESSAATKPPKRPYRKRAVPFAGGEGVHPCTECGKRFRSWKALFGHMRCHPERHWRGINPPAHLRHSLPSPSPPIGPKDQPSAAPVSQATVEEEEVAECLVMLSSSAGSATGAAAGLQPEGLLLLSLSLDPPEFSPLPQSTAGSLAFGPRQSLIRHRTSNKNVGCFPRRGDEDGHDRKMAASGDGGIQNDHGMMMMMMSMNHHHHHHHHRWLGWTYSTLFKSSIALATVYDAEE